MSKYAWTWKIKKECLDEYVRMHLVPGLKLWRSTAGRVSEIIPSFITGTSFSIVLNVMTSKKHLTIWIVTKLARGGMPLLQRW